MTGVRNGPLARAIITVPGFSIVGQVPAGFTWLIKTLHLLSASGSVAAMEARLVNPASGIQVVIGHWDVDPAGFVLWQGWTTAGPGDRVAISAPLNTTVWLSGAELPGTL